MMEWWVDGLLGSWGNGGLGKLHYCMIYVVTCNHASIPPFPHATMQPCNIIPTNFTPSDHSLESFCQEGRLLFFIFLARLFCYYSARCLVQGERGTMPMAK
jgi:hypothetical protein